MRGGERERETDRLALLGLLERASNIQRLRLALSKRPNRVGVFFPSPEDGNRLNLRNIDLSSYLEFQTMDI
jgi:hypothetical protein